MPLVERRSRFVYLPSGEVGRAIEDPLSRTASAKPASPSGVDRGGLGLCEIDFGAGTIWTDGRIGALRGFPSDREQDLQPREFWRDAATAVTRPVCGERRRAGPCRKIVPGLRAR